MITYYDELKSVLLDIKALGNEDVKVLCNKAFSIIEVIEGQMELPL